jgi:hypothetical protein
VNDLSAVGGIDVELIRLEALGAYKRLCSEQKVIWIIAHQAWSTG